MARPPARRTAHASPSAPGPSAGLPGNAKASTASVRKPVCANQPYRRLRLPSLTSSFVPHTNAFLALPFCSLLRPQLVIAPATDKSDTRTRLRQPSSDPPRACLAPSEVLHSLHRDLALLPQHITLRPVTDPSGALPKYPHMEP
ncbi:hypothetical protein SNOG_03826 [Parastagonospora nodorum SN15]|uniref:Uncharacterized protein n=1 Tax=Phaeosphaeria nodorum (strain SN15 / ATCC MYA-4574 / FGSC 10173) TaxID=321614 RepID=Q0UWN8_PHANO|nr:hypothetical protein SNOG_03826 [Parastagonospora nodorum SN15]EAT89031.1 hypothetical protein SNOG_03826 [Parastagonospora nodorum SN15]